MVSAREIAAWRTFARWSSDVKVEQDYLLSKAVAAIFEDKFLSSQVAMRGGTVLHKGHLAPAGRYSEDIDLVRVGDRPASHLKKALTRVLHPLLTLGIHLHDNHPGRTQSRAQVSNHSQHVCLRSLQSRGYLRKAQGRSEY
jgi:predicted nucleotidyltransferase component of viral defense system